jgi:outer membrane lipoprotein SlyB
MAEKAMTTKRAYEITVQLQDGQVISVVQEADVAFSPGEQVRVLYSANGTTRVSR